MSYMKPQQGNRLVIHVLKCSHGLNPCSLQLSICHWHWVPQLRGNKSRSLRRVACDQNSQTWPELASTVRWDSCRFRMGCGALV